MVGGTKEAAIVRMRDHRTSCSDTASNRRLSLLKQLLSSVFNRTRSTFQTLYFPDCPLRVTNALSRAASIYSGTDNRPQPADPLPSQSTGCTTSRRLHRCLRRRGHNVAVQAPELPAALLDKQLEQPQRRLPPGPAKLFQLQLSRRARNPRAERPNCCRSFGTRSGLKCWRNVTNSLPTLDPGQALKCNPHQVCA